MSAFSPNINKATWESRLRVCRARYNAQIDKFIATAHTFELHSASIDAPMYRSTAIIGANPPTRHSYYVALWVARRYMERFWVRTDGEYTDDKKMHALPLLYVFAYALHYCIEEVDKRAHRGKSDSFSPAQRVECIALQLTLVIKVFLAVPMPPYVEDALGAPTLWSLRGVDAHASVCTDAMSLCANVWMWAHSFMGHLQSTSADSDELRYVLRALANLRDAARDFAYVVAMTVMRDAEIESRDTDEADRIVPTYEAKWTIDALAEHMSAEERERLFPTTN